MKLNKIWQAQPRSFKNRLRVGDFAPDGVVISIGWDRFVPGTSVFVPCVNTLECTRQFYEFTDRHDWVLDTRIGIEGGRWGVRFWRVL